MRLHRSLWSETLPCRLSMPSQVRRHPAHGTAQRTPARCAKPPGIGSLEAGTALEGQAEPPALQQLRQLTCLLRAQTASPSRVTTSSPMFQFHDQSTGTASVGRATQSVSDPWHQAQQRTTADHHGHWSSSSRAVLAARQTGVLSPNDDEVTRELPRRLSRLAHVVVVAQDRPLMWAHSPHALRHQAVGALLERGGVDVGRYRPYLRTFGSTWPTRACWSTCCCCELGP
jgi:hypothetical protein